MTRQEVEALFVLARIDAITIYELPNGYWPDTPEYQAARRGLPWWLVRTEHGLIKIGWRKRVIAIDWSDSSIRKVVTIDNVTKDDTSVHAWSLPKALEYLISLRQAIEIRAA